MKKNLNKAKMNRLIKKLNKATVKTIIKIKNEKQKRKITNTKKRREKRRRKKINYFLSIFDGLIIILDSIRT